MEFAGPVPDVLEELAAQAESIMARSPYVDPYSVQNNWNPTHKEWVIQFSQPNAQRAGVTRSDVGHALKAAGDGYPVGVIKDREKVVAVNLVVRNAD